MARTSSVPGIPIRHAIKAGVAVLALVAALSACGSNDKEKAPAQKNVTPSQSSSPTPSTSSPTPSTSSTATPS
ncbi:hypothetical protein ACFT7S_33910 [Streptomyces sp. NPDC057136]|uniref:hypothetical protein n=1 Tax=Streptomyces sp. NPDC057136 TaxID=3346029 RepID=UPI0036261CCF